jgi:hypothetical protein
MQIKSKCIAANVQKIYTKKPGVYVRHVQPPNQPTKSTTSVTRKTIAVVHLAPLSALRDAL